MSETKCFSFNLKTLESETKVFLVQEAAALLVLILEVLFDKSEAFECDCLPEMFKMIL